MRTVIRYTLTAIAAILVGLVIFTAETVVDEAGYTAAVRSFVRDGWSAVVDAGYADWIQRGALLFVGAAVALWVDYGIRRFIEWYTRGAKRNTALIVLDIGTDLWREVNAVYRENIYTYQYFAQSDLIMFLVFNTEVEGGHIGVLTTSENLKWTEESLTNRSLVISLSGNYQNARTLIEVKDASITTERRQQPNVEQAAITITKETMDQLFQMMPPSER